MKKIVVIGSLSSGTKNNPEVLASRLSQAGTETELVYWEQLVFDIKTGNVRVLHQGRDIIADLQPDLVVALGWYKSKDKSYYRDVAYSLALYLRHGNIKFWNSEMAQQRSTTKLSCMVQLALEGIAVPSTSFSIDTKLAAPRTFPVVVKAIATSRGKSNFVIGSAGQFEAVIAEQPNQYIVQPFMPNDHDLRVICVDTEPSLVLRRSRSDGSDTHLNNTSQGGEAEWLELGEMSEQLLSDARKICIIMKRELGGVDFIPDPSSPSGYSCLEVNAIPQLTSGHDTNKKLDMLVERLAKETY